MAAVNIPLSIITVVTSKIFAKDLRGKPTVVIVGGSFSALTAYRHLANHFNVQLIDYKNYFEYTPGILRAFVQPSALSQLTCPLAGPDFRCGEVTEVAESSLEMRTAAGSTERVEFDYLLVGAGSLYTVPIKPTPAEPTLLHRADTWRTAAEQLAAASSVLVIGGGPVGVELAAEVLTQYPDKQVTIVDALPELCASFPDACVQHVTQWLTSRSTELVLGEWIGSITEKGCTLKSGRVIEADITYKCMGFKPNTGFMAQHFGDHLDKRGMLRVTDTLQVKDHPNIFGMGDLCLHKSLELKLGHTAELNAHLVAQNVDRHHQKQPLLEYPFGVVGSAVSPKVYVISLGKYDGVLLFNSIAVYGVLGGFVAAIMKWLLEWTKVAAAQNKALGIIFWRIADFMSVQITHWLLPLRDPAYTNHSVILFDGQCALCHGFVSFVIRNDNNKHFKFASLQSSPGQKLLRERGLPANDLSSMVMVDQDGFHRHSSAALRICYKLDGLMGFLGKLLYAAILVPSPLRNLAYKCVAANRYRLFGKVSKGIQGGAALLADRMLEETKDC